MSVKNLSLLNVLFLGALCGALGVQGCKPPPGANPDSGGSDVQGVKSAAADGYSAYKNFNCSVEGKSSATGKLEKYSVVGKYRVHEVGGQYEMSETAVLKDLQTGVTVNVPLTGVNVAPLMPNRQSFFSGDFKNDKSDFHLNIQVTTNVQKDFQIKADVENRKTNFRKFGNCNFSSFVSETKPTSSRFVCKSEGAQPGGHSYVLRLQQHPKDLNQWFEQFLDVSGSSKSQRIALVMNPQFSDLSKGTKVLVDKSLRLRVTLYNVAGMGNSFKASLSHTMEPPSVAQKTVALPVLTCLPGS